MNHACKHIFRTFLKRKMAATRTEKRLTQERFAELLMMDTRSYAAIEKGEYCCSALTLMIFLVNCCDDVPGFLEEFRTVLPSIIKAWDAS